MQINIRVIASAKQNKIVESDDGFKIYTTTAPEDGKANGAVIKLLAKHFDKPKSHIEIIRGHRTRDKVVSILD